jgi:hypothetical protein
MNLDMNNSNFAYTATIKLNEIEKCKVQSEFPGVSDLAISSRNFQNYFDCSNSVKRFMESVATKVNSEMPEDHKYVITTEVNPVYSGVDTKSKDWDQGELARVWMFTAAQEESNTIHAVGQARVFVIARAAPQLN